MCEGPQPYIPTAVKILALLIAFATIAIILTLLYMQWTRVGAPTVDGFAGRYLYPLVPLILLALPSGKIPGGKPGYVVALLAIVSALLADGECFGIERDALDGAQRGAGRRLLLRHRAGGAARGEAARVEIRLRRRSYIDCEASKSLLSSQFGQAVRCHGEAHLVPGTMAEAYCGKTISASRRQTGAFAFRLAAAIA